MRVNASMSMPFGVRKSVFVISVLVALGIPSVGPAAASSLASPRVVVGVDPSIHAYQVINLSPRDFLPGNKITLSIAGHSLRIALRDSGIMAVSVRNGNSGVRALRGAIEAFPQGEALFTATDTELRGFVSFAGHSFFIEPAQLRTREMVRPTEVIYSAANVTLPSLLTNDALLEPAQGGGMGFQSSSTLGQPNDGRVIADASTLNGTIGGGVETVSPVQTESTLASASGHGNSSRSGSDDSLYYMIRFGIYADSDYCNAYSDWYSRLVSLMNFVSGIYNSLENIQLQIYDGPRCIAGSGSWSSDATTLLSQFNSWCYFTDSVCKTMTDVHMATGKSLNLLGLTYTPNGPGLSMQTVGSDYQKEFTATHEIGHSFYGLHGDAIEWPGTPTCPWYFSIVWPTYEGDCAMKFHFSATNGKAVKAQAMFNMKDWFPYTAQSTTSSDGFYVTSWWVRHPRIPGVGDTADLHYHLWTGGKTVTMEWFVGCRNGAGQAHNCDFGYVTGTISGDTDYSYIGLSLSVTGGWQLWPAYYYNGHYGPYQWSMVQVPVTNAVIAHYDGPDTSADGVQLWDFYAHGPSSTVHTGDTLVFDFFYFNPGTANLNFDPYGIFTAARDASNNNKDFFQTVVLVRPSQVIGGQTFPAQWVHWTGWITVTTTGTWTFWPAYYLNGVGWGPYGWHQISITVSS